MPITSLRYRYFQWDGSTVGDLDAEQLLAELADDIAEYGSVEDAIRRMYSRGIRSRDREGLSSMLRQLSDRQNEHRRRYDLSSPMRNLAKRLDDILRLERGTIHDWLSRDADSASNDVVKSIAERNLDTLNQLPSSPVDRINELQNYDFLNPDAQKRFLDLLKELRDAVTDSFFKELSDRIDNLKPEDLERMKSMVKALNDMLVKKIGGESTDEDFKDFMAEFGDLFGDEPPQDLDELLTQIQQQMMIQQSLLWSMSRDQRAQLSGLMQDRFGDAELNSELAKLRKELDYLLPPGKAFGFRGDEELDLKTAMKLMERMRQFEQLKEQMLRADRTGDLAQIDRDLIKEVLGENAEENVEDLAKIRKLLEESGFVRRGEQERWELTPLGARKVGFKALAEIYSRLRKHNLGAHAAPEEGRFGDRLEQTKAYDFGDPLHLNLPKTLHRAILRGGIKTPVDLEPSDFEIDRSELLTSTATVMCLDLSTSMAMRGAFQAAKKVALALQQLISAQFPTDQFHIVGFDVLAKEVKPHELLYLQWDEYMTGTNMEHALLLSRQLLANHNVGSKQIILISDGEPTVHFEKGRTRFNYPPTRRTLQATYKAVQKCTRDGIAINTFMLDVDGYFMNFIDELTRINGGRVFFTDPRKLGEYILVDYVKNRRTQV